MGKKSKRDTFSTGYQRDNSDDKPAFEMLPWEAITCLAWLTRSGAKKYGNENYRKGAPLKRTIGSSQRHLVKALLAIEDETLDNIDPEKLPPYWRKVHHLVASAWNNLSAAQHLIDIFNKKLNKKLDDRK